MKLKYGKKDIHIHKLKRNFVLLAGGTCKVIDKNITFPELEKIIEKMFDK